MKKFQEVFKRKEVKYLLSWDDFCSLRAKIAKNLKKDRYYQSTNCSIYFDTPDFQLANRSLDHPVFKQKIRLRSYNTPKSENDQVFLEIKRKYKGVGSKRRIAISLKDYKRFQKNQKLTTKNPNIDKELKYYTTFHQLRPKIYIAYERHSFVDKNDPNFRLTFDHNIRSRLNDLRLEAGDHGDKFFKNREVVMEAKTLNAFPSWYRDALRELKIYPTGFQKYGYIYLSRKNNLIKEQSNV